MLSHKDFPPLPSQERQQERKRSKPSPKSVVVIRNTGSATPIDQLPDELILAILEYLPCLDQQNFQLPSLISLSLTNRRLHALVLDKLYAAYDSFFCSPYPFLRTVISDQQLAARVRSSTFRYGPGVHSERVDYRSSALDKKIIKEGLKALGIPSWKSWASDCNSRQVEQELLYTAILMHTPNIVSLNIYDGALSYKTPTWLDVIRGAVSGGHFGRMHQFHQLKSIRVDVMNLKLRHLAPVFRLQSLRKLTLIGLLESNEQKEGKADYLRRLVPAASSPIEDLSLRESFVNANVFSVMLGFIQALQHLEYTHTDKRWLLWGDSTDDYWLGSVERQIPNRYPIAMLHYPTLLTALERHYRSLQSLSLVEEMDKAYIQKPPDVIGSLREFENLTRLDARLGALINLNETTPQTLVEKMPRSLRTLRILISWFTNECTCVAAVEHMVACCRDFMPLLEEVRMEAVENGGSGIPYDWERLLKSASEQGVNLVVDDALKRLPDGGNIELLGYDRWMDTESDSEEESLYSL